MYLDFNLHCLAHTLLLYLYLSITLPRFNRHFSQPLDHTPLLLILQRHLFHLLLHHEPLLLDLTPLSRLNRLLLPPLLLDPRPLLLQPPSLLLAQLQLMLEYRLLRHRRRPEVVVVDRLKHLAKLALEDSSVKLLHTLLVVVVLALQMLK